MVCPVRSTHCWAPKEEDSETPGFHAILYFQQENRVYCLLHQMCTQLNVKNYSKVQKLEIE